MLYKDEIMINSFAQEKITFEQLMTWFDGINLEDQRQAISRARLCLDQSHPKREIIDIGIETIPLKPTMTPVVLFKTQGFKIALQKILVLPDNENRKTFITLVSIFKVTDTYRRNVWCKDGCKHEWHNLEVFDG